MDERLSIKVLSLNPRPDQAAKPSELIQITGHQTLSLNARRSITILWHNAHRQGVEEGKDYVIELSDLVPDRHKGYEMVEEAVISLMQTLISVKRPDGSTRRVQFLGGNDMDSPERAAGTLTYSFDKRLIDQLKDSDVWGKISLPVLMSLGSKYSVSLYENVAQWTGLTQKTFQEMTLDEFRELLGVEDDKYPMFGALNKHVIKPVVQEINALAPFNVSILPVKTGKRVTHIRIGWWSKDKDGLNEAFQELERPKVGRRARIKGQTEAVLPPTPSSNRLTRKGRLSRD